MRLKSMEIYSSLPRLISIRASKNNGAANPMGRLIKTWQTPRHKRRLFNPVRGLSTCDLSLSRQLCSNN